MRITQAEIARQDIRERHDFAALWLEAFESLSQADAAHRRRMVRRQLKVLGLVPLNSDDFNSMSQQVRGAGVEPWLACIHRHEKTGAPCMLRVHDGGDHYYASPSREELLRVKVESVGPFPAVPAFNSPEAVAQAADTIRGHTPDFPVVAEMQFTSSIGEEIVLSRIGDALILAGKEENRPKVLKMGPETILGTALLAAREREYGLEQQRDELADALESYLRDDDWERDAEVTINEQENFFYAKITRQDTRGKVSHYISRERWRRRDAARAALAKAGR